MDRPTDTRSLSTLGEGQGGSPALRETSPADAAQAPAEHHGAQWSAFVARILRPAIARRRDEPNTP